MEVLAVRGCAGSQATTLTSKLEKSEGFFPASWCVSLHGASGSTAVVFGTTPLKYGDPARRRATVVSASRGRESVDRSQRSGVEGDEPILAVVLERSEVLPRLTLQCVGKSFH